MKPEFKGIVRVPASLVIVYSERFRGTGGLDCIYPLSVESFDEFAKHDYTATNMFFHCVMLRYKREHIVVGGCQQSGPDESIC